MLLVDPQDGAVCRDFDFHDRDEPHPCDHCVRSRLLALSVNCSVVRHALRRGVFKRHFAVSAQVLSPNEERTLRLSM